jgi:hypothetical protein
MIFEDWECWKPHSAEHYGIRNHGQQTKGLQDHERLHENRGLEVLMEDKR